MQQSFSVQLINVHRGFLSQQFCLSPQYLLQRIICWCGIIETKCLLSFFSETGTIYYSNAELTAVDLVQYEQHIGGLSRAATILEELSELIDFSKISESLFAYTSLAAIQRLGFILDVVLQEEQRANDLYDLLCKYTRTFKYVFLSTRHSADVQEKNTRWKIKINTNIEVDDI